MNIEKVREINKLFAAICKNNNEWFTIEQISEKTGFSIDDIKMYIVNFYGDRIKPNVNIFNKIESYRIK